MAPILSIIIPAYNESATLPKTAANVGSLMEKANISCEIIFVDDGSTDDTWQNISDLAKINYITGIKLSRNFGKESAILAGLAHAKGNACAILDCDLQHPPHVLLEMYDVWKKGGVDVVEGIKVTRGQETAIYRNFSNIFYYLIEKLGKIELKNSSDFQLLDRRVVDIIATLPERQRFFRALSAWVGYNRVQVPFTVAPREFGQSKFNFYKSMKYAVANITSFSSAPMQAITIVGIIFFATSLILGINTFYSWLVYRAVEGFTTVILLLLIIGSMLMFSMGVIGIYISKIYEEIKSRPTYLVEEVKRGE